MSHHWRISSDLFPVANKVGFAGDRGLSSLSDMLATQSGNLPTPRDMRGLNEEVGKAILQSMKAFSAKESAGDNFD